MTGVKRVFKYQILVAIIPIWNCYFWYSIICSGNSRTFIRLPVHLATAAIGLSCHPWFSFTHSNYHEKLVWQFSKSVIVLICWNNISIIMFSVTNCYSSYATPGIWNGWQPGTLQSQHPFYRTTIPTSSDISLKLHAIPVPKCCSFLALTSLLLSSNTGNFCNLWLDSLILSLCLKLSYIFQSKITVF